MELQLTEQERAFRDEARAWLQEQLNGPFKDLRGRGASGDQDSYVEERIAWGKATHYGSFRYGSGRSTIKFAH